MSTYPVWRKAADKKDVKRLTFVCGSEYLLVEEVIYETKNSLSAVDYYSINLDVDSVEIFNNTLFQYPLSADPKLIVVRNTDRAEDWSYLSEWLETAYSSMPQTHVLFISSAPSLYLKERNQFVKGSDGKKVMRAPASLLGTRGRVVECKSLSEEEQVKYVLRYAPGLNVELAKYLTGHVSGEIGLLRSAAERLDLFRGSYIDEKVIEQIVDQHVGTRYTDLLLNNKKYLAVKAAEKISVNEYHKVFRQLDNLLDVMSILNVELRRYLTKREQQEIVGVEPWQVEKYGQLSFSYDRHKIQRCRNALAYVEDAMKSDDGYLLDEEDGVLEALTTLWV